MDCKQCNRASKAQYLPAPPGMVAIYRGGERGYFVSPLVAVRFDQGFSAPSYIDVVGQSASAVLYEVAQVVYVMPQDGVSARIVQLCDWLSEVQE